MIIKGKSSDITVAKDAPHIFLKEYKNNGSNTTIFREKERTWAAPNHRDLPSAWRTPHNAKKLQVVVKNRNLGIKNETLIFIIWGEGSKKLIIVLENGYTIDGITIPINRETFNKSTTTWFASSYLFLLNK